MDADIKPTPEEDGKEFGYFPFEELPPAVTHVVEEVIVCENEAEDIKIHHIDPVEKIAEVELPMPTERFITKQKGGKDGRSFSFRLTKIQYYGVKSGLGASIG